MSGFFIETMNVVSAALTIDAWNYVVWWLARAAGLRATLSQRLLPHNVVCGEIDGICRALTPENFSIELLLVRQQVFHRTNFCNEMLQER